MLNRSKKVVSLFVLLSLVLSLLIPVSAVPVGERVRARLEGFGLMQGHEDGTFGEDEELTRAQMCMIAARILQMENVDLGENSYTDVADDHWAKGVITTLSESKIVNGMGNNTFMPDKSVTYFEAAKILVSVLGYGSFAEDKGGFPNGYLAQASNLGLLKDVTARDAAISRGEVAHMVNRALDVKPIGSQFVQNYPEPSYTLEEILSNVGDLVQFKGILTETAKTSLTALKPNVKEGQVILGDTKLLCDMPMEDYLGCELIVYAYLDNATDKYKIKSFTVTPDTFIVEADAEDVLWNGNDITLLDEEGEEEDELTLSDSAKVVYNGRLATIPSDEREITYGSYTFVDRDENGIVDVMLMNEAQSFVIDKVNAKTQTVYFKDNLKLNGRNAVSLDAEKEDKAISLTDAEGNALTVEELEADWAITVFASKDQNYVAAIVSQENVTGKLTSIKDDEIAIDGTFYELAKDPNGVANFTPSIGEEATYILDCYGKVAGRTEAVQTNYKYVYVNDAKRGSGLATSISLQTIAGQKPQKEVKISAGKEMITYYFQNEEAKVYDCTDNCAVYLYNKYTHEIGNKQDIDNVALGDMKGTMAALRLNGEGKVRELYLIPTDPELISGDYEFNANILSFGGEQALNRGYATDENTMFICLPEDTSNIDNFYVQVSVVDESSSNNITGGVFFPDSSYEDANAEPVDILLIQEEMDASYIGKVDYNLDICIVGEVMNSIDEAGDSVYAVEMLNNDTKLTLTTKAGSAAETVAKTLRKGDLIRFTKDSSGKMINIDKMVSIQGLGNSYSRNVTMSDSRESGRYGLALHTIPEVYDHKSNQMVDRLTLVFNENGEGSTEADKYRLFHEDMQTIYKYERQSGWISKGSIEDIRTYEQVGADADKILAVVEENDIKAIVIITD